MASKTLILQGLTQTGATALAGTDAVLDVTERVLGVNPALSTPTVTSRFYSTITTNVVEGSAKYLIDRKANITELGSTAAIHNNTIAALTTVGMKQHKRDAYVFTLDKSWETGYVYDKKKDPKVREGELISDLASLKESKEEAMAATFWDKVNTDIVGTASALHPKYPKTSDGTLVAAPAIKEAVTIPVADKDDLTKQAGILIDKIYNKVDEIARMGRKNDATEEYPYARGTNSGQLGLHIVVKSTMVALFSRDERFVQAGISPEMISQGVIGMINQVPVVKDEMFDTTVTNADIAIIATGKYSPVIVADELADAFMLFDHPTKPTRAQLLEGSGGFDAAVTPYINLSRFIKFEIATSTK